MISEKNHRPAAAADIQLTPAMLGRMQNLIRYKIDAIHRGRQRGVLVQVVLRMTGEWRIDRGRLDQCDRDRQIRLQQFITAGRR